MQITGAELFVKALLQEQVDTLFAYPGGQAIDLFNALYGAKGIDIILPRHEQGLIHAADGYARSTGKTGVCLVTSGPGATNLVTGIATANYDCVPLVCFTGQVPTHLLGNRAFQEVGSMSILWTKKVERLCCFFKFLILLLLWCQITNRAMYPFTVIPAFYVFKDCSASFL